MPSKLSKLDKAEDLVTYIKPDTDKAIIIRHHINQSYDTAMTFNMTDAEAVLMMEKAISAIINR